MTRSNRVQFLGDLELMVLEHLWSRGPCDAKQVHAVVGKPRSITVNTVQSTLKRLHEKGLLSRDKVSHAYVYRAALGREEVQQNALGEVIATLMGGEPHAMLSAFVELADRAGTDQLRRLEELIEQRLRDRKDDTA